MSSQNRQRVPTSTPFSAGQRLAILLDDEEAITEILSEAPGTLTAAQRDALRRLVDHFGVVTAEGTDSEVDSHGSASELSGDDGSVGSRDTPVQGDGAEPSVNAGPGNTGRGRRRRRRGTGAENEPNKRARGPHNPWHRIMNIQELRRPPELDRHIAQYETDPESFLTDGDNLRHHVGHFDSDRRQDAFLACYTYTEDLSRRCKMDQWRWNFNMLMYFDMVKIIHPASSGRNVGRLMGDRLNEYIVNSRNIPDVDSTRMREKINEWKGQGRRLNILCDRFGSGCMFFLQEFLSSDFVGNKFVESGEHFDKAMVHLGGLGLADQAEASRANELGNRIREFLIRPFQQAQRAGNNPPVEGQTNRRDEGL